MIDVVADLLRCPVCQEDLVVESRRLACCNGHGYDIAKQGYVNLLGAAQPRNADTAAMVRARLDILSAGFYAPLITSLTTLGSAAARDDAVVLDAGAGPGAYLSAVLAALPDTARGIAVDVSVPACRRAAKADPRAGAVVADTWAGLPVRSAVADVVLVVFAPRNLAEFARVLRPGGRLIAAMPDRDHLIELRDELGLLGIGRDRKSVV